MRRLLLLLLSTASLTACLVMGEKPLTSNDRTAIGDSIRSMMNDVNGAAVAMNAQKYYQYLSASPDARRFDNGDAYPSADSLTKTFAGAFDALDSLRSRFTDVQVAVVSRNAVSVAAQIAFTAYGKNGQSFETKGAVTALFQREDGAWKITQWHESEHDNAGLLAAIMAPPKGKKGR